MPGQIVLLRIMMAADLETKLFCRNYFVAVKKPGVPGVEEAGWRDPMLFSRLAMPKPTHNWGGEDAYL